MLRVEEWQRRRSLGRVMRAHSGGPYTGDAPARRRRRGGGRAAAGGRAFAGRPARLSRLTFVDLAVRRWACCGRVAKRYRLPQIPSARSALASLESKITLNKE